MTTKITKNKRKVAAVLAIALSLSLCACALKDPASSSESSDDEYSDDVEVMLDITDETELAAVAAAKAKVAKLDGEPRIIATSPSVAQICDALDLDLVGVASSVTSTIPERYEDVTQTGASMNPDMEIIASLNPDWILSPLTLKSDLQPKYDAIGVDWAFLNLRSVQGMYRSIQELGEIFDREEEAAALVDEFTEFYTEFKAEHEDKDGPEVLVLMGLLGSYIIATENSYVGNLVQLAGGHNVYEGTTTDEFITVNTEDMKTKEPDIIICAYHALPDSVMAMFAEEFETNDIWKHFEAVQNDRIYYVTYEYVGMSATFDYPEALEELEIYLYAETEEELAEARAHSDAVISAANETNATEIYKNLTE